MAVHDNDSLASRGEVQANVAIAFLVLAWFFIALRVWTRTCVIANFGWDDSTMILAGMLFTVYCGAMLYINANGGGTHISNVAALINLTKWTIVGEATYLVTIMMLKISLGIFFARIVVKSWQLWTIYVTVAINIFSSIASFFYVLLRCGPNLDKYVARQLAWHCTPRALDRFFAYQQASITTLTDCVFVVLPVIVLWNAHMDTRSKFSVGFILSLAALGIICSMIRFQYVDGLTQIEDFFWNSTNVAIWSTIEPGAGIIAGCLATLRPLLKRFWKATARSIRSSTDNSTKELAHSFPWNDKSMASPNRKAPATASDHNPNHSHIHILLPSSSPQPGAPDPSPYAHYPQTIELKSDADATSTFPPFEAEVESDDPRPKHHSQAPSLDLDRRNSYTNYSRQSLRAHRMSKASDTLPALIRSEIREGRDLDMV